MAQRQSPVPDEYDYVVRRVQHPWLLQKLYEEWRPEDDAWAFLTSLAAAFRRKAPALILTPRGTTGAFTPTPDDCAEGTVQLAPEHRRKGRVAVGILVHEYAHIEQYHWWVRMRGRGKKPEWKNHGPAFIDALDRVAIEAAKLLE